MMQLNWKIMKQNDRYAGGGGGVLIAIKKEMKSILIKDETCKETSDTLYIIHYTSVQVQCMLLIILIVWRF